MSYKLLDQVFYNKTLYGELYNKRYNSDSTYRFDFKIKGSSAFVFVNPVIVQQKQEIIKLNKKVLVILDSIPAIALKQYINTCLVNEIKMTNDIEGVYIARKEIQDILDDKVQKRKKDRLYGLVKKYEMVLSDNVQLSTNEDVRKLYDELVFKEVVAADKENKLDGKIFRAGHVHVQNSYGQNIHNGIYPEEAIEKNMQQALNILNDNSYDFLIRIAVFHYLFGYIHPFYDGNGRTNRFISSYLLSKKLQCLVPYRLSSVIRENIHLYYKSFNIVNDPKNKGDLTSFVLNFFDIIIQLLENLNESLTERNNKLTYFTALLKNIGLKNKNMQIILDILVQNSLFGDNGLTISEIKEFSQLGESSIRRYIKFFNNKSILNVKKESKKNLYSVNLDNIKNKIEILHIKSDV